jgi:DNA end-binding protein Ku
MEKVGRAALAEMVFHDKEQLVLIRPARRGLVLHLMFYRDEVGDFGALPKAEQQRLTPTEIDLAKGLVKKLSQKILSRKLTLMNTPQPRARHN